jgi:dTDP-4-dehydrorhamnose 3,5-epimerase
MIEAVIEGWQPTPLEGVLRRGLIGHPDQRGAFSELWRASWTGPLTDAAFVQANLSASRAGVLRGMHFHRRQADCWIVVEGRATVGLVDLRDATADDTWRPGTALFELGRGEALYIPPLVAHGFYAPEELSLLYLVSNEYDGTDELGFAWDDPLAGLSWPTRAPLLSDRDQGNPTLPEAVARLLQGQSVGA